MIAKLIRKAASAKTGETGEAGETGDADIQDTAVQADDTHTAEVPEAADAAQDVPADTGPIGDLLRITARLTEVLEQEIELLRSAHPGEMQALQEDKDVLAAAYEARLRAVSENPAVLDTLDGETRERLRTATDRFNTTLRRNEQALHAARQTTDAMLRAVVNAVDRQQRAGSGYSPYGTRGGNGATPLSVDQRF